MKPKNALGILAASAALFGGLDMQQRIEPRYNRRKVKMDGHSSWGHYHDAKVKRGRAKERRAKNARKINWA